MTKGLTAKQYAQEFINDLPETLAELTDDTRIVFCKNTLREDPELKILRQELNKHDYDLIPDGDIDWKLVKLTK